MTRKRIDMSPGVPYVSVRSNDVLNGSLDLVLRLCTRIDTVWRVLRPGREVGIFLLDPLIKLRTRVRTPIFVLPSFHASNVVCSTAKHPLKRSLFVRI